MPCILMMYATSAFEPDLPALLCSPLVCAHNTYPLLLSMKQTSDLYKSCTYYTQWLITSPAASMTMAARNFNTAITLAGFCLSFLSLITANSTESSCSGPIQYYLDVGCTPVFKSPGDPCPEKYNCDHLKNLPTDKCVVNGHEYAIGESLREEDSNPCDIGCFCSQGYGNGGPTFTCAIVDCFFGPTKPGCYRQHSATSCCSGPEVCPEKPEDVPTCTVDGKVYKDGEYFAVPSEPNKSCYCGPGYTGENVEPFCYEPKRSYCSPLFRHASDVRQNCVPTYYQNQSPKTSCSVAYRCQNNNDVVIARSTNSSEETKSATSDSAMKCTFGNLTMNVGDELNQATDYSSVCVKCVCEVPPIPTCQRLPDEECDVTEHPNFSSP